MNDNAIILFTRIPVAGKTKTRLRPLLSDDECCRVQRAFIMDVYAMLQKECTDCDIYVCFSPEGSLDDLMAITPGAKSHFPQIGGDLGEKMFNAMSHVLDRGYKRCLLMGSDVPQLKAAQLRGALGLLDLSDIVICPTDDGGYYLIGMKEPYNELFSLDEYGVSNVYEKTIDAAKKIKKRYAVGTKLMDVDEPEDLLRLAEMLKNESTNVCVETRKVLKDILNGRV